MTKLQLPVYAYMGGTFDPVHHGHLRSALEVCSWLGAESLRLVPARSPVHKQGVGASADDRLTMLSFAVADEPRLCVDPIEIESDDASYTVNTLKTLRARLGDEVSLCFVMGMDSYLSLPTWKAWEQLLDYCHIIVVARPGYSVPSDSTMHSYTQRFMQPSTDAIHAQPSGCILLKTLTPLAISSTQVRTLIAQGESPRYLVSDNVWNFIRQNGLYGYNL